MVINFPTTLDTTTQLPTESASTPLSTNHVVAHTNLALGVIALETKVGINGSAITTTHDYKLSGITGSDKAVSLTGTETITTKTLGTGTKITIGSDATGDIWYRHTDGTIKRLGVGADGTILKLASGVPSWAVETVTNDASTTVKGIVEAATSAEVSAGTATGGTGAVLVVTPDALAASAPVFSAENLTNIPVQINYAVNADETANTYQNFQLPMVGATSATINGWTLVTVTTQIANATSLAMGGTTSADFTAQSLLPGSAAEYRYRYDESKIIRIKFKAKCDDLSDRKGFGLCITPANIHTAQTDVTNGEIRFIWNTTVLYAQNANGTATSTDISSGVTGTNWNTYEIIFTPGVNAKFYVNGTLKATHTTNLPTTGTPGMTYGANANGRVVQTTFPVISIQN